MAFPPNPTEGDTYYTEKYIFVYESGKWVTRALRLDELAPGGGSRGAFFPPYSSVATLRTSLSCADGKIEFSKDNVGFESSVTVDIGEQFFAEWSAGILTASQGIAYTSTVNFDYLDLNINENLEVNISSIDKLPNPFTLTPQTDTQSDATLEANTLAMLGSINAPTYLWGSSDSSNAQVNIANTGWQSIPTTVGTLVITSKDEIRTRHFTNTGSNTVTTTTINIGYADTPGAFQTSDFVTTNESIGVQQPQITYPTGTGTLESIWSMPITTSGYGVIGNAGGMVSSRWEIATDDQFLTKVLDETVSSSATSYNVPDLLLPPSTDLYLRVTFTSSLGYTATSLTIPFSTSKRLISYTDESRTWTLPYSLSQYHRVFRINLGNGNVGGSGTRGNSGQAGPGGGGGAQGTIRYREYDLGGTDSFGYDTSGSTQSPFTDSSVQNEDGSITIMDLVVGTDIDGNDIQMRDVFAGMNLISGDKGAQYTACGFCGGPGGGGAGGIYWSYDPSDNNFETFGAVPPEPIGAKGGDNTPPSDSGRQNQGADGGRGFGAGAGGGAGGPEDNQRYGNPGDGGSPGARGASLIVVV